MAAATINLKLEPAAFDVLREALGEASHQFYVKSNEPGVTPKQKSEYRAKSLQMKTLLDRIS